jgi:hypothetical protein
MTFFYVLMSVVGFGLVALGASLLATARPGWILLIGVTEGFRHRRGGTERQSSPLVAHGLC